MTPENPTTGAGSGDAGRQPSNDDAAPALRLEGMTKRFGGTLALDHVTFEARPGQIHALLGENGAGKSTLVRIMGGVLAPDRGRVLVGGEERELRNAQAAFQCGIAVVHQELAVMDNMSVADNLSAGAPPLLEALALPRWLGMIDRKRQRAAARETLGFLGVEVPLNRKVGDLSLAVKQQIEVARAASRGSRVLILDEPTSALPPSERQSLYEVMALIRQRGVAIVFITHNVREAIEVSDVITVLRDGRIVASTAATAARIPDIIGYMTGTAEIDVPTPSLSTSGVTAQLVPAEDAGQPPGALEDDVPRLRLVDIACAPVVRNVSLHVAAGEIVGVAGLVGSGRTELLECVFGARRKDAGEVLVDGIEQDLKSVSGAIAAGIGLVPEDRQRDALFLNESVGHNMVAAARNAHRGGASGAQAAQAAKTDATVQRLISDLHIKTPSAKSAVRTLSGGNQQKVVLARWMMLQPRVLLADDPGRGISIGSKREVHRLLRAIAAGGAAILLTSSEFDELADLCDRVVVIDHGVSVAEFPTTGLTGDMILRRVLTLADREASARSAVA
jgi:ribose transport system ATP-binding protein